MPNATSKDWDKHSLNEMDRRHREAELRDSGAPHGQRARKPVLGGVRREICPTCKQLTRFDDYLKHYKDAHTPARKKRKRVTKIKVKVKKIITPKKNEKPRVTKDILLEYRPTTNIRILAQKMKRKTLENYLLKLAQGQGLQIQNVTQSIEEDVADKILSEFK